GNPAVALHLNLIQDSCVEIGISEYRFGLLGRTPKFSFIDARDAAARDEPREFGRRIQPRQDDDPDPLGKLFESLCERGSLFAACARLVEIVEHDSARIWQHREKIAEVSARESSEILFRLERELR